MVKKLKVLFAGEGIYILTSAVDCAHHGAAPAFLNWEYTSKLYGNMVRWCAKDL